MTSELEEQVGKPRCRCCLIQGYPPSCGFLCCFCFGGRAGWCKYKITPRWFHISSHWFSTMALTFIETTYDLRPRWLPIRWSWWLLRTSVKMMSLAFILIQKILHQVTDYPILYDGCYTDFSYQQINCCLSPPFTIMCHSLVKPHGHNLICKQPSRWWFHMFFLFSPRSLGKWCNLTSICFKWVETTT